MKILKVVYDENTKYILDIVNSITTKIYLESYDYGHYKDKKKAIPIMTRQGAKQLPLVVFEDENLIEFAAIWAESKPDWLVEINKILKND